MANTNLSVLQARMDARLDPILSFRWVCVELPFGHDPTYVEEIELPFPDIQPKEGLFGAATFTYYPAFEDISAFDVTFYEDSKLTTSKWLTEWRGKIRNPKTGAYYLPGNYKFDLKVELLDTEGSTIGTAKLMGIWPATRGSWPLDYGSSERLRIQQNFSCDALEFEFA